MLENTVFELFRSREYKINLIYDVVTHSLYSVDDITYKVFKSKIEGISNNRILKNLSPKFSIIKLRRILKECELVLSNQISSKDEKIDTYKFLKNRCLKSGKFTLMITQDCNLRCKYCYGGESGRYRSAGQKMSIEVARNTIDFLLTHSRSVKHYHLGFFGGEPMLNFPLIKEVIAYCEHIERRYDKKFTYSMTTNGTLLTEGKIKFLRSKNVGIMISLDGPEEIHNENRIYRDGRGSYKETVSNLDTLKKYQKTIIVRATVTRENFQKMEELIKFFNSIGISRVLFASASGYEDINPEYRLKIHDYKAINSQMTHIFKKILKEIMEGKDPLFLPFIAIMQKIHSKGKSIIGCGVFRGTTAVSADGNFYPCHRFVGMRGFEFGDVKTGIDYNKLKKICNALDKATIECNYCWAKYLCARSCIREIACEGGEFVPFKKGYCDVIRKVIKDVLIFYTLIKENRPEMIEKWSNQGRL